MEICPQCDCKDFYVEKHFPRVVGLGIVGVAIIASFWTYGLSLIGAAILDGLLFKFVPNQLVCYRCRTVYRDVPIPRQLNGFDRHVAELYDYGKS